MRIISLILISWVADVWSFTCLAISE